MDLGSTPIKRTQSMDDWDLTLWVLILSIVIAMYYVLDWILVS